jgi:hypothetical protein
MATPIYEPTPEEWVEVDVEQLRDLQKLTPEERLRRHEHARRLVIALRKAGTRHYGFDPSAAIEAASAQHDHCADQGTAEDDTKN